MMKRHALPLDRIRVPVKRRATLDEAKVAAIAEDWMQNGQQTPIRCRVDKDADGEAYVLIAGYHRLEAARVKGDKTINGSLEQAEVHLKITRQNSLFNL